MNNQIVIKNIFLDDLPRWRFSKGQPNGVIDWKKCVENRCVVKFRYEDVEGEIKMLTTPTVSSIDRVSGTNGGSSVNANWNIWCDTLTGQNLSAVVSSMPTSINSAVKSGVEVQNRTLPPKYRVVWDNLSGKAYAYAGGEIYNLDNQKVIRAKER
jgi:hypothetical protein